MKSKKILIILLFINTIKSASFLNPYKKPILRVINENEYYNEKYFIYNHNHKYGYNFYKYVSDNPFISINKYALAIETMKDIRSAKEIEFFPFTGEVNSDIINKIQYSYFYKNKEDTFTDLDKKFDKKNEFFKVVNSFIKYLNLNFKDKNIKNIIDFGGGSGDNFTQLAINILINSKNIKNKINIIYFDTEKKYSEEYKKKLKKYIPSFIKINFTPIFSDMFQYNYDCDIFNNLKKENTIGFFCNSLYFGKINNNTEHIPNILKTLSSKTKYIFITDNEQIIIYSKDFDDIKNKKKMKKFSISIKDLNLDDNLLKKYNNLNFSFFSDNDFIDFNKIINFKVNQDLENINSNLNPYNIINNSLNKLNNEIRYDNFFSNNSYIYNYNNKFIFRKIESTSYSFNNFTSFIILESN